MSNAHDGCHLRLVVASETRTAAEQLAPPGMSVAGVSGRDLARGLARIGLVSIDAAVWRHTSPREQSRPDSGSGAIGKGGRFNPPGSFPVIYGSLSRSAAGAEFRRLARRHPIGIDNLLPRHLYRFRIRSESVLDLRLSHVREALDLPEIGFAAIHRAQSQLIGEVARALGIDVIVAPSATGDHDIAAIFPELIPRSAREFQHMEIWIRMSDVPRTTDLETISMDDRMSSDEPREIFSIGGKHIG